MRTVDTHLLEQKMDEVVTHYINTHQHQNEVRQLQIVLAMMFFCNVEAA